ncbi:glutathione synthase [Azospirillum brasilense]|uniref:Glutathione synthetase n=1 Tax=Azospirillum brasilense TaxID=192 RepID=A0A560CH62_AZOBR|nr:glutathione synthase [Azospirillum brasilense]TWA84206.1 glutathione synthase [Azospirillum brasilense]
MSLAVAFQMDPIESINIDTDSSFMMALEAQKRGHTLYHYHPCDLSLTGNVLTARVREMTVVRKKGAHYTLGEPRIVDLSTMDVVLMRQDPPFDMAYITATHMLEHIQPKVLVLNDPAEVRNAPEKLFVTHFPDLMPPTLITSDKQAVLDFRAQHKDIIVKPLFGNGGAGVFHLKPDDENLGSLLELFTQLYREPVIVQKYLPEIRQGDKRIILIDGEPAGAVSRMPQEGEARANFHAGGSAKKTELTAREQEICKAIGPVLRAKGLVFVGIDVIGDYMTEINVTSPTGIQEINRLDGSALEATLWDAIERRHHENKGETKGA